MTMKKIIQFIIQDFKTDIQFLRQLFKGEYKITEQKREELKNAFNPVGLFVHNWMWLLLIILAFCVGWFCAAQHYQDLANLAMVNFVEKYPCIQTHFGNLSINISDILNLT